MTPTQLEPETLRAVTLQAQQWQVMLRILDDVPHRVARPLFDAIMAQCAGESSVQPGKLNGGGHAVTARPLD